MLRPIFAIDGSFAARVSARWMPDDDRTTEGKHARRFFVVTPYEPRPDGVLVPQMPEEGPCTGQDERACRLGVDHRRQRTTGPCFALTVARCRAHGRAFTLYPPGHVPYGRKPIAEVAPEGGAVSGRPVEGAARLEGTIFDAALDATQGCAWRRCAGDNWQWCQDRRCSIRMSDGSAGSVWSTQGRHLDRATRILGLSATQGSGEQHELAELLCVDVLTLHEARTERTTGYQARGRRITQVLASMPVIAVDRLAEAGAVAGLWGLPLFWDAGARRLRRMPFRAASRPRREVGATTIRGDP